MKNRLVDDLILHASDEDLVKGVYWKIINKHGGSISDIRMCTQEERDFFLVDFVTGIVGNGGFEYLFSANLVGDPSYSLAANAFKSVGLNRGYEAFLEALSQFPEGQVPLDPDVRSELYEETDESRRLEINKKFWQDGFTGDNITDSKLAQYIRDHAAAFRHLDAI